MNKNLVTTLFILSCLIMPPSVFAAHPLATDDAGTNGARKFQLETSAEFGWDKQDDVKSTRQSVGLSLSAGILDTVDLVLTSPFTWQQQKDKDTTVFDNYGMNDLTLEVKWRFLEFGPASFAIKPGIIVPIASRDKGLGNGRPGYGITLISTVEFKPVAVHANAGYVRQQYVSEDRANNREDLYSLSLAGVFELTKSVQLVAAVDTATNPDKSSTTWLTSVTGGFIYAVNDALDFDLGIKRGLSKPETDTTLLTGLTFKFP
jgi:hypothetical protein